MCIKFAETSPPARKIVFLNGCSSYKPESIAKHEMTEYHCRALRWFEAKKLPPGESQAEKALLRLNKDIYQKLVPMFRNCHAIGKMNRPLSDFLWLCELDEMKGIKLGETYINRTKASEFLAYITLEAFSELAQNLAECKFVSIMGDETTDISAGEQSMWFTRSCKGGVIQVNYLDNQQLDRADAESIVNCVKQIVSENLAIDWKTFVNKLVATTTDGASVMLGKKIRSGSTP